MYEYTYDTGIYVRLLSDRDQSLLIIDRRLPRWQEEEYYVQSRTGGYQWVKLSQIERWVTTNA